MAFLHRHAFAGGPTRILVRDSTEPETTCGACVALTLNVEKLITRITELEKLTAHLRPRVQNDKAMREDHRRRALEGRY